MLVLLVLAAGCTSRSPRSIDGSCWAGRTRITSVDGTTGQATWSRVLPYPREDRPEVTRDTVLVRGCGIVVLAADDGRPLYRQRSEDGSIERRTARDIPMPPGLTYGAVLAHDGTTAVVDSGLDRGADGSRVIVGVDLVQGVERWRVQVARAAIGDARPVIAGGVVVLATEGDGWEISALDLSDGRVLWRRPGDAVAPAAAGDLVVVDDARAAVALDPRTGKERWRVATRHHPLLAGVPGTEQVLVLDSPPVAHGSNDCC